MKALLLACTIGLVAIMGTVKPSIAEDQLVFVADGSQGWGRGHEADSDRYHGRDYRDYRRGYERPRPRCRVENVRYRENHHWVYKKKRICGYDRW